MRLAINGWFLEPTHTGSSQYLHGLLAHLPAAAPGLDLHVIAPAALGELPALPDGIQLHYAGSRGGNVSKLLFEQLLFPRAAQRLCARAMHIPYWAPPLRAALPFVLTVHDLIPMLVPAERGGILARLYTALAAAATPGAAQVLADSHSSARDILRLLHVAEHKLHTVQLAAGVQFTPQPQPNDAAARARYALPESYVLYLGGFQPRKNVGALLSAWTWAHGPVGDHYPLVIAGALPAHSTLPQDAQSSGVADSVHFIGAVREEDKPAVYRGAACLVYPSLYEGFGLPPLEAMACGVPVITSNISSLGEVVADAAYLVADPHDARQLGAAIISLVVDGSLADDLRARGLKQAARFSWQRTATETARVYNLCN